MDNIPDDDNAPLTKGMFRLFLKELNQKFDNIDKRFDNIDKRFDNIDKKINLIDTRLNDLQGYQDNDAKGIEDELQMVLQSYLKKEYPLMTITKFKINNIKDPITKQTITNLDAAVLLLPYNYEPDYDRLYSAGIAKLIPRPINKILSNIFVMAEAKHHIERVKIKTKINQFERIQNFFILAKKTSDLLKTNTAKEVIAQLHVTNKFIITVQRNPNYANVDTYFLFFGALYWQRGLLLEFQTDLEKYTKLSDDFTIVSTEKKIKIYNDMRELEKKWCSDEYYEHSRIDLEEIAKAHEYQGILYSVKLIQPSGERYKILKKDEPLGLTNTIIHGGNTRKNKNRIK